LVISNSAASDSGSYAFTVGRSETTAKVAVDQIRVTSKIKDVSAKETQQVMFECDLSHPDIPSGLCLWTKNGVPVKV